MAIVFITLFLSIVIFGFIALLAFFEVAFSPPPPLSAKVIRGTHAWQPPMIRGADLSAWARDTVNRLIPGLLSGRSDSRVAVDLAAEIRSGVNYAMGLSPDVDCQEWASEEKCYSMNSLTPPEVIEIGEYIRRTRRAHDVESIASRASDNSRQAEGLDRAQYHQARIRCPLLSEGGSCTVQGVEPLQCRAGCPLGGDEPTMMADRPDAVRNPETHAMSLTLGVERGISEAIEKAGLDGTICEFNCALAVALNTPDAATRWIDGDRIFDKCQQSV
jgi:hypothetical protein